MKKVFAFALVFVMALSGASFAADWPTGTVNVVLPYGAGGDTDTYCRQLFQRVSKITGQTFVVINQQGGSGIVAAMDVLNKKPDGYTILFNHTGASLVQEATGMVDFSYTNSFENCCTVAIDETYSLVAISPEGEYKSYSKGWKTLADMIAYAKENPGKVRYSTVFGSTTEYVGTMLERQAGVEFDNINVGTSGGERMAAMLGGQVDILAANYMQVKDYIEKGDLVCLAVMSKQRVPGIDYPTFAELGY
ncbi:MAG: tripartite tricarboxylate transporter substrate binding protein, partial [Synergistaceae bacterium]|nr:tripartite tricarboxylate transporter substrate binding protein [Synergistaceae bacterium]